MNKSDFSRGELAKETGVNLETIRYYEKAGLMPDPPRTESGYRIYNRSHLKRLSFIRRCRELGFTLGEVRRLLELVDGESYTCAEVLDRTLTHLTEIRSKIRDLQKMQRTLQKISKQCSGEDVPECPIVEVLWNKS